MADKKISALTSATTPLAGTEVLPIVQSSSTVKVSVANLTAGRDVSTKKLNVSSAGGVFGPTNVVYVDVTSSYGGVTLNAASGQNCFFELYQAGTTKRGEFGIDNANSMVNIGGFNSFGTAVYANGTRTFDFDTNGNLLPKTAAKGVNFTANTPAAGMTSQLLNWYEEGTWTPTNNSMTVNSGSWAATGTYTRIGRTVFYSVVQTSGTVSAASGVGMISGFPFTPARPVSCTYSNSAGTLSGVGLLETNSVFYGADAFVSQTALRFSGTYQV